MAALAVAVLVAWSVKAEVAAADEGTSDHTPRGEVRPEALACNRTLGCRPRQPWESTFFVLRLFRSRGRAGTEIFLFSYSLMAAQGPLSEAERAPKRLPLADPSLRSQIFDVRLGL